jgi:hypothetical protein
MNAAIDHIRRFAAGDITGRELHDRCAALRGLPELPHAVATAPLPEVPDWQRVAERELLRLLRRNPKTKVAAALAKKKRISGVYSTWRKCDHALRILRDVDDERERTLGPPLCDTSITRPCGLR